MTEIIVAQEQGAHVPAHWSAQHPMLGLIDHTVPSPSLRDFADNLGWLPTVAHDVIWRAGLRWDGGKFADPKAEVCVAAAKVAITMGTRRRVALALNFQSPGTLDSALRLAAKMTDERAAEVLAAHRAECIAIAAAIAEAATVTVAPKAKPAKASA